MRRRKQEEDAPARTGDMRLAGQFRIRVFPCVLLHFSGGGRHSTGKNMPSVAAFVLRRKTRPGMPCFEYVGRPMKLTW